MNLLIDDGSLTVARPRAQPRLSYPFGNFPTPDNFTRIISRAMVIRPAFFELVTARRTAWENLLKYSNAFEISPTWEPVGASIDVAGARLPDRGISRILVENADAAATHFIKQDLSFSPATSYARYLVMKPAGRSRAEVSLLGSVNVAIGFDLETGRVFENTLGRVSPSKSGMIYIGDGWWFCWLVHELNAGISAELYLNDGVSSSYDGDGTSGMNIAYDHLIASPIPGPVFFTDAEPRTISAPDLDPGDVLRPYDPFSFLLEETDPQPDPVGRETWDRNFGRIPPIQTVPATLMIQRPPIPGDGVFPRIVGDYFVRRQFNLDVFDAYYRVHVDADSGIPAFFPTSGDYTVTFEGDTTGAIAWNADAATVETALNALTSVTDRGGCTVTGAYNDPDGFQIVFANYATGSADDSGLVCGGSGVSLITTVTPLTGGYRQDVTILPRQDNGFPIGTSSFGPAGANPMTILISNTSGFTLALGDSVTNLTPATSGTFTLTWFGDTTAPIAWNASAGDIQTALNLLAGVTARGGCTVTFVGLVNLVPTFSVVLPVPAIVSGDFTVTLFGDTTGPIAWNASIQDIEDEINLLAGVTDRGGCTVNALAADSLAPTAIKFSVVFGNSLTTGNVSSLLPPGAVFTPSTGDGGINRTQSFRIGSLGVRVLTIPGHPIQTGQECFIPVDTMPGFVIDGSRVTRLDENTVSYTVEAGNPDADFTPVIEFDPLTKRGYRPGTSSIPSQRQTEFFLPGVSFGIAAVADIPIPQSESDTDTFLQRAFSGVGEINWQVGEVVQWKGPIVSVTKTLIRASDV